MSTTYERRKQISVQRNAARAEHLKTPAMRRAEAQAAAARSRAAGQAKEEQQKAKISAAQDNVDPLLRGLSTSWRVQNKLITGALGAVEGIVDLGIGAVGAVGGLVSEDFREGAKQVVKYNATEQWVGKHLDELTKYSYTEGNKAGEIVEGVAEGVGQMLPAVIATVATGGAAAGSMAGGAAKLGAAASKLGMGVTMASAAGNATQQAYEDGADYYEGLGYGVASGAVEGATEKLTGGVANKLTGFGKGIIKDSAGKVASQGIKRIAKEAVGEGAEEALAELANPALKSIYKGKDAINEYFDSEYLKGVGESALVGALTSVAFGQTVGRAVGGNADINASLEAIQETNKTVAKRNAEGRSIGDRASTQAAVGENYLNIERVLKKASPEKRAKLIEQYELDGKFDADGTLRADFAARNGFAVSDGKAIANDTGRVPEQNLRYVAPSLRYDAGQVEADIRSINADIGEGADVTLFGGELSENGENTYTKLKQMVYNLSDRTGTQINVSIVAPNNSFNGVTVKGRNIYISADVLENADKAESLLNDIAKVTKKASLDKKSAVQYNRIKNNKGGAEDGAQTSENPQVLGERTQSASDRSRNPVWQQGDDPETVFRRLGDDGDRATVYAKKRNGSSGIFKGEQGRNGSALLRSGNGILRELRRRPVRETDTAGRSVSADIRKRFSQTVCKDENGALLSLYHWTDAEFDTFAKGDIGFHFGTLEAAHNRAEDVKKKRKTHGSIYKEVYLNIKNPAVINFDPMRWNAFSAAYKLNEQNIITDAEIKTLESMEGFNHTKYDSPASVELRRILAEKGYDGIIYSNFNEGNLSIIAFSPDQIVTVSENGVDIQRSTKTSQNKSTAPGTVIHEVVHVAEGTKAYGELMKLLAEDEELVSDTIDMLVDDKSEYGYTKEIAESCINKLNNGGKLTVIERSFISEIGAHMSEKLLGEDEVFIEKLVRGNTTVAEKTLNMIAEAKRAVASLQSSDTRAKYNRLRRAEKLYLKAVSAAGMIYRNGKITRREEEKTIEFSRMNSRSFSENVRAISKMTDEHAQENLSQGNFVSVMKHTPSVILDNVKDAEDIEVIARFDAIYLATRKKGVAKGHYHDLGVEVASKIPEFISNPDAIIRLDNGRINLLARMTDTNGKQGVISVELNTVKDINSQNDKYNLVISAFNAKDNYIKNILHKAIKTEYKKEDLPQVNPQLYEWLATINEVSSKDSISQSDENVNSNSQFSRKKSSTDTDNAQAMKQISEESEAGMTYRNGKITRREEDESKPKYSIRKEYAFEIDEWNRFGKPEAEVFELGTTGDVLRGLGAIENDIFIRGDKIKKILTDHPEMTLNSIKKIPQILENPVLILKSKGVGAKKHNSRMLLYGNIKATNGQPVLVVLDLKPIENYFLLDDMQKVNSAYTKTNNPAEFLRGSEVLYADKRKTAKLFRAIGLQYRPIALQDSGFMGSISYQRGIVNIYGEKFSKVFGEISSDTDISNLQFSRKSAPNSENERVMKRISKEIEQDVNTSGKSEFDKVYLGMSDSARTKLLRKKFLVDIPIANEISNEVNERVPDLRSWQDINQYVGAKKRTIIQTLAREFDVFKKYEQNDTGLTFEFTNNNFRESYGKQKQNFESFAKLFSVFDEVIDRAVGIEVHRRDNYKEDPTLKKVHVLMSAFEDGERIIPVKLEIKEFSDKQNTLYVAITLDGIKKAELIKQGTAENGVAQNSNSAVKEVSKQGTTESGVAQSSRSFTISISKLMRKVNPKNTNFTKYFPNELLTPSQISELKMMGNKELITQNQKLERRDKRIEAQKETIKAQKAAIAETARKNELINRCIYLVDQIRDLKSGKYIAASEYQNHAFKEGFEKLSKLLWRGNIRNGGAVRAELKKLYDWYVNPKNRLFHDESGNKNEDFDHVLVNTLEELGSGEGELTLKELEALAKTLEAVCHHIKTYNKVWNGERWIDARGEGARFVRSIERNKEYRGGWYYRFFASGKYQRTFADNASVFRAADCYDEHGFFTEYFEALREGLIGTQIAEMELREELEGFYKKHKNYVKRLTKEKIAYKEKNMTVAQYLSLYMTSKRKQSYLSFAKTGFKLHDEQGNAVNFGPLASDPASIESEEQAQAHVEKMRKELEQKLTKEDLEYVAILERAYVKCAELKREMDMIRWGYSNVISSYYYPIQKADTSENVDESFFMEVERTSNLSFNKSTVRNAGRLFIEPVDTVFNRHVRGIALYSNLAMTVENMNRVLNVNVSDTSQSNSLGRQIKENKYLRDSLDALKKLKNDIEGMRIVDDPELSRFIGKLRSNYARSALAANPKIFLTQLSSFFAATSILNYQNMVKGFGVPNKSAEVDKYCPLAKLRNTDNTVVKAQTVSDKAGKISDKLLTPVGKIDRWVVVELFGGCQVQIEAEGGAKVGTEANKIEAGKLLERVILETQQNTLLTEKSAAMRSNQEYMKFLTMFSADAMKVMGRVYDGMGEVTVLKAKSRALKADPNKNAATIAELQKERDGVTEELEELKKKREELGEAVKNDPKTPTYEELVAKKPIQIINVNGGIESGSYADMKAAALNKATNEGWFDMPHHNADTDSLIFLTPKSFTHAYSNLSATFGEDTVRSMAHIPEIINEAVLVSVDEPRNLTKREKKVYTFFGAIEGKKGLEPVKLTVKEYDFSSLDALPKNIRSYFEKNGIIDSYSSLYDACVLEVVGIDGIKEESDASGKGNGNDPLAQATSDSTISIADLLNLVKGDAEKYIPKDKKDLENQIADLENRAAALDGQIEALNKNAATIAELQKERDGVTEELEELTKKREELGEGKGVVVLAPNSELSKRIENSEKSKYSVIRDYLIENFYGQEFTMSDGKRAIMDKRDAQELSHKADKRRIEELASLKEIVENAKYHHFASEVTHKKFSAFYYYVVTVQHKSSRIDLWINVGVSKNDGINHIYDIVEKKNEAPTHYGVSRPVGNAIPNASSDNRISQNFSSVNIENEKTGPDLENRIADLENRAAALDGQIEALNKNAATIAALQKERDGVTEELEGLKKKREELGEADRVMENMLGKDKGSVAKDYLSMEDFVNRDSSVWKNIDYNDEISQKNIMQEIHAKMIKDGSVVKVSETVINDVGQAYPDLREMKKKERLPILKESINKLKNNMRQFLNGFKDQSFEFEVNGKVLEAKLYNTGINEVLEKITQEKASMLYTTEEIFNNARYLYSTQDYDYDPNVYRWNYFYSPVQIGKETVGVRIAVRDTANPAESQIYNWNIKKDTSLDGVGRGTNNRISHGVSSNVSIKSIPQPDENVKDFEKNYFLENQIADLENRAATIAALQKERDGVTEELEGLKKKREELSEAEKKENTVDGGVKHSLSDIKAPTRNELLSKPPMKVVDISTPKTQGTFGQRRKLILDNADEVISRPYINRDTGRMIFLTKKSYTHAFNNLGEIQLNAAEHIPELIENAVLTHAEEATHGDSHAEGVYTFFAGVKYGHIHPVKLKVKKYTYSGQELPKNIKKYFDNSPQGFASSYDTEVLSVEKIEESSSGSVEDMNQNDSFLDPKELSKISIADLLNLVNGDAEKYIPKDKKDIENRIADLENRAAALDGQIEALNKNAATIAALQKERDGVTEELEGLKKKREELYDFSESDVLNLDLSSDLQKELTKATPEQRVKIVERELKMQILRLGEYTLNDGTKAIIDNTDIRKIGHLKYEPKNRASAMMDKLVKKAKLDGEAHNVEHPKFTDFKYYKVIVKLGENLFECTLNVGLGKFDNKYHIYDVNQFNEKRKSGSPILSNPRKSVEQTVSRATTEESDASGKVGGENPRAHATSDSNNSIPQAEEVVKDFEKNYFLEDQIADLENRAAALDKQIKELKNEPAQTEKKLKQAKKKLARSTAALAASSVFMAAIALFFKWLYGKTRDEEKEDIAKDTLFDLFGNMLGGLPLVRDIYSAIAEGFDVDVFNMSALNDLIDSCRECYELAAMAASGDEVTDTDVRSAMKKSLSAVGMMFGIPVRNTYNLVTGLTKRISPSAGYWIDSQFYSQSYTSDLKEAIENDDEKMISTIAGLITGENFDGVSKAAQSSVRELISKGYTGVLPRSVGDSVTYDGDQIELSARQKKRFKEVYGIADESVDILVTLPQYRDADDEVKAKAIKFIYDSYYGLALEELVGAENSKLTLFAEAFDIEKLALIISTARSFESDKDRNGKVIQGSKKAKIIKYLESLRMSAAQKHMALGFLGYNQTKGREKVEAYIGTLRLTKDEKIALLEHSGYVVA